VNITIAALAMFSISFFIAYIHAAINLKKTTSMLTEIILVHLATTNSVPESIKNPISPDDIHKENFIKFLSDSRDWAYQYIEDVQKGISEFVSEVEPSINYFNEYGIVIEGMPLYNDMKKFSDSFEKLKKLLPEDIDDRR
jgi:hypothetical protein